MSYVDVQHSPWPADGLPLAKAFWVVIDQRIQARVKKVSDQIWRVEDHASINNFCDTMEEGHYRGKGRRGSPTAELTDIPATAWKYFDFLNMYQSVVNEGIGGIAWYDVRIWPVGDEPPSPEPLPLEPPGAQSSTDREPIKDKGGHRPEWDWSGILLILEEEATRRGQPALAFETKAKFEEWIINNVQRLDGGLPGDGPHLTTVRRAIVRHKLLDKVMISKRA